MKKLYFFLAICTGMPLFSQAVIVLPHAEIWKADNGQGPSKELTEVELEFIRSVRHLDEGEEKLVERDLIAPPPDWGKVQSEYSFGMLKHYPHFPYGFVADVFLQHLLPTHDYMLTINGRPDLDGNGLLPEAVPGNEKEKYYNVLRVQTDPQGNYSGEIAVLLPEGDYHARFYIKDTDDWKIVLYHDYFRFSTHRR